MHPDLESIKDAIPIESYYKECWPGNPIKGEKALCVNPNHADKDPSLVFYPNEHRAYCFGCKESFDIIKFRMIRHDETFQHAVKHFGGNGAGHDISSAGPPKPSNKPQASTPKAKASGTKKQEVSRDLVEKYIYVDEQSNRLFEKHRFKIFYDDGSVGKSFVQYSYSEKGQLITSLEGVKRVLYQLDKIVKSKKIIITEGEKDVHGLQELFTDYAVTTSSEGSGSWERQCNEHAIHKILFDKDEVVVIGDHDEAGRKYEESIVKTLRNKVKSLKVLRLPGLDEGQDASDFIEKHGPDAGAMIELLMRMTPEVEIDSGLAVTYLCDVNQNEIEDLKWIIQDILPVGLTLLVSPPKIGKSYASLEAALRVARGKLFSDTSEAMPMKAFV